MKLKAYLRQSAQGLNAAWKQYPLLGIAAIVGYILYNYIYSSLARGVDLPLWAEGMLYAIWLSMPLIFVLSMIARQGGKWPLIISILTLLGIIVVAGVTIQLDSEGILKKYIYFSYGLMSIAVSLMVPLFSGGSSYELWRHSQQLAIHFVLAILFASLGVLLLILALNALEYLFGLTQIGIKEQDIAIFSFTIGHTFIFLALWGNKEDGSEHALSKFLKILGYYVLTPASILYTIILYAYVIRLVIISEIPEGWISNLVLGLAAVVASVWSVLYPDIVTKVGNSGTALERIRFEWLRKWIFITFIPLAILQLTSVVYRIYMWGWTIPRYGALWMGLIILFSCIYMLSTSNKKLHHIAWVALITFLLGAYGPFNAYAVSLKSVQQRIQHQMDLFEDLSLNSSNDQLTSKKVLAQQINDDAFYLYHTFGKNPVVSIFEAKCPEIIRVMNQSENKEINYGSLQIWLSQCLDYDFLQLYSDEGRGQKYFYLTAKEDDLHEKIIDIKSFQSMIWVALDHTSTGKKFALSSDGSNSLVSNTDNSTGCSINLTQWIEQLNEDVLNIYELTAKQQTIEQSCSDRNLRFLIHRIEGYITIQDTVVTRIEGIWLE